MNLIQQIGAYAGFAAVIGLAVLSALYFSQARDLRRLREWAGRAPDRGAPASTAQARPAAAQQATPRGPAQQATGAAAPGATGPGTVPAETAPPVAAGGAQAPAVTALRGGGPPPATTQGGARAGVGAPAPAQGGARAGVGAPAPPQGGGAPPRPASATARNSSAARRPAVAATNGSRPERSSLPYVALAVVGALIVLGAGAFALGVIGERAEPGAQRVPTSQQAAPPRDERGVAAPGSVTFSVLNGTNVEGLAKQVADELEAAGYRRGNVTNAGEQRTESIVLYASGARSEALAVGRKLGIREAEPIDARSQALAGDATVVVVVGADQTQ